jgi:hypothetical protein
VGTKCGIIILTVVVYAYGAERALVRRMGCDTLAQIVNNVLAQFITRLFLQDINILTSGLLYE